MRIRPAESRDLRQIVDVFWRCWTHTYADLPALQAAMDVDRATGLWTANLADPDSTVLVAEADRSDADGGVLGVVRYAQEDDGQGYVGSLYVAPDAHGRGVGSALLTAAERALADGGAEHARLWVFAVNDGAQEFYRRCGWRFSGRSRTRDPFGERELGMTKALPTGGRPDTGGSNDAEDNDGPEDGAARGAGVGGGGGDRVARRG